MDKNLFGAWKLKFPLYLFFVSLKTKTLPKLFEFPNNLSISKVFNFENKKMESFWEVAIFYLSLRAIMYKLQFLLQNLINSSSSIDKLRVWRISYSGRAGFEASRSSSYEWLEIFSKSKTRDINFNFLKLFLFLFIFIFFIGQVFALGVTPGRTTIEYEKDFRNSYSVNIVNSDKKDVDVVVAVQGELKDLISVSEKEFSMTASESSKQISFSVDLSKMPNVEPGLHKAEIVILELPGSSGTSEAYVDAVLAVISQVRVNVPYPGKYAQADLKIFNANQGEEVTFVLPVLSKGKHDLVSVKANVDIFNRLDENVASFNTKEMSVPAGQRRELVHDWVADVPVGNYRAFVTLIYDGESQTFEGNFKIGNDELELQSVDVDGFSLGDIAKIEMLVENKWSEPISDVYIETLVFDDNSQVVAEFKSASETIDPLEKKVLLSYWDTAGVTEGTYDTKVNIKYGTKIIEKDLQLKVTQNDIEVIGLGYVISNDNAGGDNTLIIVLVAGIVVLVLMNIVWFLVLRKKLKK